MDRSLELRASQKRGQSKALINRHVFPGISRAKAFFMLAAGLSFLMSVSLFFTGDRERGIYVGLWVPSILSAGALLLGKEDRND